MTVSERLRDLGGVARRGALGRLTSRREVDRAVAHGEIVRLGRGRYGLPGLDEAVSNPFESALRAICLDVPGLQVRPQVTLVEGEFTVRPDLVDERLRIVCEADSLTTEQRHRSPAARSLSAPRRCPMAHTFCGRPCPSVSDGARAGQRAPPPDLPRRR